VKPDLRELVAEWERANREYIIRPTARRLRAVMEFNDLLARLGRRAFGLKEDDG
jgi:hypothetical protein